MDFLEWALESEDKVDLSQIEQVMPHFAREDGLPVIPREDWQEVMGLHPQEDFKEALARHIIDNAVPFPLWGVTKDDVAVAFRRLRNRSWDSMLEPVNRVYKARYEYVRWTPDRALGLVSPGHQYNCISNYHQQHNRIACGGYNQPSPLRYWTSYELLRGMNWNFWRYPNRGINAERFRHAFGVSTYIAIQFRPQAAKGIYGWLQAKTIMDPSCGWGDRLAAFYCTDGAEVYIGSDPNKAVWQTYQAQCQDYELLLGVEPTFRHGVIGDHPFFECLGAKRVLIVCAPAEDVGWGELAPAGGFDLMFTSPPYFSVERYAEGTTCEQDQSWSRYPAFEDWRDRFLFPVATSSCGLLRDGGHFVMNIADPLVHGKRHVVCDDLGDHLEGSGMEYLGFGMMAIKKRPTPDPEGAGMEARYAEPIWVYRKGPGETPPVQQDVFHLFSGSKEDSNGVEM